LPARRNRWLFAAQLVIAAVVLWFIGKTLYRQWSDYRAQPLDVHPRWWLIALSGLIVLLAYLLLIQTWREILAGWNARLSFGDAARIWFVSNLGKYVPGKVWQIGTMAVMAQQQNVSGLAASGSAILNALVNLAVGIAIAVITGWSSIQVLSSSYATLGIVVAFLVVGSLLALPFLTPHLVRITNRVSGRELGISALPPRAIYYAILGNVVAWLAYGAAFELLVMGVVGEAPGTPTQYIAAYTSSYVLGYLALAAPGGLGVRDASIAATLPALGIATPPQAVVIMVASRIWLTVLELVPSLIFLARRRLARPHESTVDST